MLLKIIPRSEYAPPGISDAQADNELVSSVSAILKAVKEGGDQTVQEFNKKFGGAGDGPLKVPKEEILKALENLDYRFKVTLEQAAENIRRFHKNTALQSKSENFEDGSTLGQRVTAIDKAGVYIPGGRAIYPSSVLMNVIPAQLAGVGELAVVSPPGKNGLPHELVMACCGLLGEYNLYAVGGAQAIAALAYGTETIPKVYKICGPGNAYVAEAKRQIFGLADIDSIAGPSDILILHDSIEINPAVIARDMIAQAEHDPEASAILLTTDQKFAESVAAKTEALAADHPRKEILEKSLADKSLIIVCEDLNSAVELADDIAPEHLHIMTEDEDTADKIRNAGAVFIGYWSPVPLGDYFAGPNHTLPTGSRAKFSSPLSVADFQKVTSIVKYSESRFKQHAHSVAYFAEKEELFGHAETVLYRLD